MNYTDEILDPETENMLQRFENADFDSLEYVKAFSEVLVLEGLTTGFHPDTLFEDYINSKGEAVYTPEEAKLRNMIMEHCFEVCENEGTDIYEVTGRITLRGTPAETMFDDDHEEKYAEFMRQIEDGERTYSSVPISDVRVRELLQARYN